MFGVAAFAPAASAQRPDDSYKGPRRAAAPMRLHQFKPAAAPRRGRQGRLERRHHGGRRTAGPQTQGTIAPIPIAIPAFLGDDPKLAADIADVVAADLDGSGLFQPLDRASFLEQIRDVNAAPRFADWRPIRADALVVGGVARGADGRIVAEFRLWDVASGRQLAGQRFATAAQNWRRVGHIIADQIYEQLTGEKGYFDTRVVFVDETGPKEQAHQAPRHHGPGRRQRAPAEPGPGARADAALQPDQPGDHLHVLHRRSAARVPHEPRDGPARGGRRFPGHDVRAALLARRPARHHEPAGGGQLGDLRDGPALQADAPADRRGTSIDTGPSYSPDGRQIVFEIDRDGTQQLYVMNSDGSNVHRISGGEGRYSTPVWSPRGDYIAFTKQLGGRFLIGVMRPDGSGERILTEGYHNEGPTWAPNGRVLMFFRESQGEERRPANLFGRSHRLQRASRADAVVRVRSGLVAAPELRQA